jgi:phage tail-like protein
MSSVLRIDPLPTFNFYITLVDTSNVLGTLLTASLDYFVAGFSECSGIDATVEVLEYKEGGVNTHVRKFTGRASFSNITLKQGMIFLYDDLWSWHNDFVLGKGKRKDGLIVLMDESRKPAKVWKFKRGIPAKWVGPQLNATQSSVAIESLEIAHEGLLMTAGT